MNKMANEAMTHSRKDNGKFTDSGDWRKINIIKRNMYDAVFILSLFPTPSFWILHSSFVMMNCDNELNAWNSSLNRIDYANLFLLASGYFHIVCITLHLYRKTWFLADVLRRRWTSYVLSTSCVLWRYITF